MSNETSKSVLRRLHDVRYATRYFVGEGIDVGAGEDSLAKYTSLFPLATNIRSWDLQDGDAEAMQSVADQTYDFVHSSHCLEHLNDPYQGLKNWIRICKTGGHLIIMVPDEDLYEQKLWPSIFNPDHKWSFTINKTRSWCSRSINVFDLLNAHQESVKIKKIELLDSTYIYDRKVQDQTRDIAESAIEIILKKIK
jgi:SAM-dependent methyltransferase